MNAFFYVIELAFEIFSNANILSLSPLLYIVTAGDVMQPRSYIGTLSVFMSGSSKFIKNTCNSLRHTVLVPECVAKGSRYYKWGSGGWTVFSDCGSCGRCHAPPFVCVRSISLLPCRWAALTNCDQIICWSWISSQIVWFCGVL